MARIRAMAAMKLAAAVLITPMIYPVAAAAAPEDAPKNTAPASDVRELTRKDFKLDGKPVKVPSRYKDRPSIKADGETPPVGTVRQWLGLDDEQGILYRKDYTLRGVGDKIEVWVANDIEFPEGDCRRQIPSSTQITDAQVQHFVNEFDSTMFPRETAAFSTPPDRDGTNSQIPPDSNGGGGDYTGDGDKTVTLVDNVRDDNFYNFPQAPTYIAGFFSSQINELLDRNTMTIDAFDWLHRTTTDPPDEPTDDLCTSRPARPSLYEGTFAHEWQHLLHYYTDPFEESWVNEGLSDYAQTLTGYVDGRLTVFDRGGDNHLFCFQGFGNVKTDFNPNPRDCGGPENSLHLWGEGAPAEVLADYGHTYQLMLYLADRYGEDILTTMHKDGEHQGMASLDNLLDAEGDSSAKVLHNFQTMTLVDKVIEGRRGHIFGVRKSLVTSPSLRSTVNLENPQAYDNPGAAPNGADYVPLQDAGGTLLKGRQLRSLTFEGAKSLPPIPLAWTIRTDDPSRPDNPVLWSGNANNLNVTAVTKVTVPSGDSALTMLAKYGAEAGYDYGYVVVSTDGGKTYTPVAGDKTVDGPLGPSLNGTTDGFEPHSFDLSAYAGDEILLGVQYVSDGGVNEGGLMVDDIALGGTPVSDGSSLDPFDSPSEILPVDVHNWNVRLIGLNERLQLAAQIEIDGEEKIELTRRRLLTLAPFSKVVAVIAYDEPTGQVAQYAPYTLTVNGTAQPGGEQG